MKHNENKATENLEIMPDWVICLPDRDAKVAGLAYYKAEDLGRATNLKMGLQRRKRIHASKKYRQE